MSKRSGPLRPSRLAVPLAVLALWGGLAACGGSGDDGSAPVVEPSSASGGLPVSIENNSGTTEIPAAPQRVVTVGFNDQDFVLALGVTPVGERENLGEYDATTRPWAEDLLPAEDIPTVGGEDNTRGGGGLLDPDDRGRVLLYVEHGLRPTV